MANQKPIIDERALDISQSLDLTTDQKTIWDKFQRAAGHRVCLVVERIHFTGKAASKPPTALERLTLEEQFLTAELKRIQSVKHALQVLYPTLTPRQRQILDHDFIIFGSGSAAGVLANALSADPANRVLLLEDRTPS